MKSVSEKVECVKIDEYYFRDPKERIRKYLLVEESFAKQNLLTIMKISNQGIALNIKKKTWLMLKEDINCV